MGCSVHHCSARSDPDRRYSAVSFQCQHISIPTGCVQLRGKEYRTLHQLWSDVELICNNATTFNHKATKAHKNALGLLKACRKQMAVERGLLLEAMAALHPGGPEVQSSTTQQSNIAENAHSLCSSGWRVPEAGQSPTLKWVHR